MTRVHINAAHARSAYWCLIVQYIMRNMCLHYIKTLLFFSFGDDTDMARVTQHGTWGPGVGAPVRQKHTRTHTPVIFFVPWYVCSYHRKTHTYCDDTLLSTLKCRHTLFRPDCVMVIIAEAVTHHLAWSPPRGRGGGHLFIIFYFILSCEAMSHLLNGMHTLTSEL